MAVRRRRHRQDDAGDARLAAALDAGHTVAIYSLPRLLAEIRRRSRTTAAARTPSSWTGSPRSTCCTSTTSAPRRRAEWVLEQLYAIVNARYEEQRAVIITTNLEHDELAEQITDRTVSRLEEMCTRVPLYGEDARRFVA